MTIMRPSLNAATPVGVTSSLEPSKVWPYLATICPFGLDFIHDTVKGVTKAWCFQLLLKIPFTVKNLNSILVAHNNLLFSSTNTPVGL